MKLELRGITKAFGEKPVLKGVSFETESGKAFGILGRNGAGKTTTIRILMGVFPQDGGEVLLDGKPLSEKEVGFGYLPEERGLYPKLKIYDQLVYFAELKGLSHRDAGTSVDRWLERLGMTEYRNKKLETLSKGNQQKIQLITALAHDPGIVILDEPFSGLDPVNALLLKEVVRETIARDKIVLFSSHQMNYIEEFCDRIAILNGGEIVLTGDLSQIKHAYPRTRLDLRSPDAERIVRDFGASASFGENGEVSLRLTQPGEKAAVLTRLTGEYDIDMVRVHEPSLNDIFVEYTEERV